MHWTYFSLSWFLLMFEIKTPGICRILGKFKLLDLFKNFSDLQGIKTYAKKDGDDWILNGSKVYESIEIYQFSLRIC